jgi:hypothetical protein
VAILAPELNPVAIGVDIGKVGDPTAISIAEANKRDTGRIRYGRVQTLGSFNPRGEWIPPEGVNPVTVTEYFIRHIERLSLGMSYPDQAMYLADLLCSPLLLKRKVHIRMDVTGVGRPVYDSLLDEFSIRKYGALRKDGTFQAPRAMCEAWFFPVNFVHGESYNLTTGSMGKAFLVSRLQALLQMGLIHAPDTPEVRATLDELRVYERRLSQDGKDTYGAKVGKHDDLATALGLSVLVDPFSEKVRQSRRVY